MYLFFLALLLTASAQDLDIDEETLIEVFGLKSTEAPSTLSTPVSVTPATVVTKVTPPTVSSSTAKGEPCQCVPYHLCDNNKVAKNVDNKLITGWNELNIRFDDTVCQESVEVCCTSPKDPKDIPTREKLKNKGCGYRNTQGAGVTITGASPKHAQFGEFPWVTALIDTTNNTYIGVGVIIHPEVILTTAHIASKYSPGKLKVRAGEWDTQTINEELEFQERQLREIYIHEDFNDGSFLINDVALLRLASPLQLAEHINPICLPDQDEDFDGFTKCVANGWGKDQFGAKGRYAVILKLVEVNMVSHSRCNTLLRQTRLGSRFNLHESFLCAGGEAGMDTCQGDGGAPLSCPIGDGRYKLTGLVVGGIGCGQRNVPAIYAAVPVFRRWVDRKMKQWGYVTDSYKV